MAGDWIKAEHTLPDKPEVVAMASSLNIDQDAVVGKLLRIWIWADQQTVSGNGMTVTKTFLDRITMCAGFASAMESVGWITGCDGALSLTNFDRHNGTTAKQRASGNRRVAKHRACNGDGVTESLPKPLPEKRREEINNTSLYGNPPETKNKRVPMPESIPEPNAAIHGIEVNGNVLMYFPGDELWTTAFVEWWNKLPNVHQWQFDDLDDAMKINLNQRMCEKNWYWRRTEGEFPLHYPDTRKPTIAWFLERGSVGKILSGTYRATQTKTVSKRKSAVDFAANLRAFAEGGSDEQFVFESSRVYDNGGADDGGMPEGNASLAD